MLKSTLQNMGEAAKRGKEDKGIKNFRKMKRLHISLTKINFAPRTQTRSFFSLQWHALIRDSRASSNSQF